MAMFRRDLAEVGRFLVSWRIVLTAAFVVVGVVLVIRYGTR